MKNVCRISAVTWILLGCSIASADTSYEFRLGAERNDNIRRASINPEEATVGLAGLNIDWSQEGAKVESGLRGDLEYREYEDDAFDSEVVGYLAAEFNFKFIPEAFEWVIEDNFGDVLTDPFLADTAANRETLNVFNTGPNIRIRMGSSMALEANGRWSTRNYEESDIDSSRLRGQLGLVRALSPHRRISLNVAQEKIEYDNSIANPDYENRSAYFMFESQISRGSIDLSLGYNEIEQLGNTQDGELIDLQILREITASSTLSAGFSQRFQDQAGGFVRNQNVVNVNGNSTTPIGNSNPYEDRTTFITWQFNRTRTNFTLSYMNNREDYVSASAFDRDIDRLSFNFGRTLGANWEIGAQATYAEIDYSGIDREDEDTFYGVTLSHRFTQKFRVEIGYAREERESTIALGDYVERVTSLTFRYGR